MNRPQLFVRWSISFLALFLTVLPLFAQLEVSVNKSDAIYQIDETAYFQVNATFSGTATYDLIYDNEAPIIESGSININGGQTASIPYSSNEPGVVICRVNLNGIIKESALVFAPLDINPLEEEPGDFDAFWNAQRNLKNSLPIDPQIAYHSESSYQTTYTFSLSNIEGRRTYGYISVPKGTGPFPASITFPPYGSSSAVVGADTESAEKGGMIAVSISIHNAPVNQNDPNAYKPDDNTDKDKFYYRYGLIGAMHVIDYLETRPDFNGEVAAMGVSQGGGLATILAGIDDRIDLLIGSNPTMGQHVGYKYDRASSFPYYLSIIDDKNLGNTAVFNQGVNATKYYDAMFHARRVKGASFIMTGLQDMVVPSATALVTFNEFPNHKVLMISRDGGHGHPNEYWNGRFELMRRYINGSDNPPFQFGSTNKGFYANAGEDQTVGNSANLTGQIFYDNDQVNNLSAEWKVVSGPGSVNFSNPNTYSTTANFTSNGTYTLQFAAQDDRKLNSEGKVYFIADAMTVNVTGGGNPNISLDLFCPSNQSVQIPTGQSSTNVFWNEPSVTANCNGGANYFQLAGPQNGSSFAQGTYNIVYRATDNCGNQQDCSFTITITTSNDDNSEITLDCPTDINLTAGPGENGITASWVTPTASTSCNASGNSTGSDCSSTFKSGYSYLGTFENSQFYLSNGNANWMNARDAAESAGGHLAIISSNEENNFIQENLNNEIAFIGLSDVGQEGNLTWVDGSGLVFSNFVSNYNNNQDNDFITIYPWNGEWDLNNQFVEKKYILEVPCGNADGSNEVALNQTAGGANGSVFSIGTNTITYSATDDCGNAKTCSFNINVTGTPNELTLACSADRVFQIPAGSNQILVSWEVPITASNCPNGASITQTNGPNNFNQLQAGTYTVSYQASDACGNTETCSFNIIVNQTETALSINCPGDLNLEIPSGQSSILLNWTNPTTSSNCSGTINLNQIAGTPKFNVVGAGIYPIEYEAIDECGNRETCSFIITINELLTTNLTISCPENQTNQLAEGQTEMTLTWTNPVTTTDCPNGTNLNQLDGPSKFSSVETGIYVIAYEATDNCGNRETCSFILTIEAAPNTGGGTGEISLTCPEDITLNLPYNESSSLISWQDPIASTTCIVVGDGNVCEGVAIDGYSYLGEFEGSQYYKSNDPLSYPLARIEVENEGGFLAQITSEEENEFLRQNIGNDLCIIGVNDEATEGIWRWMDGSNANFLNFPDNINNSANYDYGVINFWNGKWELTASYIYKKYILEIPCNSGMDNEGTVNLSQISGLSSGSNFGVGTTTISYEATDGCGNTATCSFNVMITQDEAPNTDSPPTVVVSVLENLVSADFGLTIEFDEPVTGLSGYDLDINNAIWYNFSQINAALYTVMLSPINEGFVTLSVPEDVAFDSNIQGNIASNVVSVDYQIDGITDPPITSNSCLIQPSSVTIENGRTVGGAVSNVINGDGLTMEDDLNALHGGGSLYNGVWLNDGIDPTLRFDLGNAQIIDGVAIWNYSYHTWLVLKRRGLKNFQVSTSEDGINYTTPTFHSAAETTEAGEQESIQIFNFTSRRARYIRVQILNAIDDAFYVGLGEVRFTNNCPMVGQNRNTPEGVNIFEEKEPIIAIEAYPNPTYQNIYLNIIAASESTAQIQVINEVGAVIQQRKLTTIRPEPITLDLKNEADGLYFIRIIIDNELPIIKRIIKANR